MKFAPVKPELDATKLPNLIEIAWAIGVFEGEGHVRNRGTNSYIVSITQKDPEILFRIRDWFGGSIRLATARTLPPEKWCYSYVVCGDRARLFTALAYPMMSARRKTQVDATGALSFMEGRSTEGMTYIQIRQILKERSIAFQAAKPNRAKHNEAQRLRRLAKRVASSPFDKTLINHERVM